MSHAFVHKGWTMHPDFKYAWKYDHHEVARFAVKMVTPVVHDRVQTFV